MSENRFAVLRRGDVRPGRVKVPPAFAVKVRSDDVEERFSLLEVTVARPIPAHRHEWADEYVYVLEGELAADYGGETHVLRAGDSVFLPKGEVHALRSAGERPPRVIQVSSPGGWECFVEDLVEAGPVTTGGAFDPVRLNEIGAKYGMRYLVPGED